MLFRSSLRMNANCNTKMNTFARENCFGIPNWEKGEKHIFFWISLNCSLYTKSNFIGIILSGNEVSQIILSLILTYFGGQKHIPKWISWGVVSSAFSCFILTWPHFIYGAGEDALQYTKEYQSIYQVKWINWICLSKMEINNTLILCRILQRWRSRRRQQKSKTTNCVKTTPSALTKMRFTLKNSHIFHCFLYFYHNSCLELATRFTIRWDQLI